MLQYGVDVAKNSVLSFLSSTIANFKDHGVNCTQPRHLNALCVVIPVFVATFVLVVTDVPKYCAAKPTFVTAFPPADSYFAEYFGNETDKFAQPPVLLAPVSCYK